jgi:hypothetical protein
MKWKGDICGHIALMVVFILCFLFSDGYAEPNPSHRGQRSAGAHGSLADPVAGENGLQAVNLIRSDENGIEIEILNPEFGSTEEEVDGHRYHRLSLAGAALSQEEGKPQLPLRMVMLGIPLESDVRVHVLDLETRRNSGYQVYPAPERVISERPSGEPYSTYQFYRDVDLYSQNTFYPPHVAEVIETAFIRDQRVAQLEVRPFQFNPVTGELLFHKRLVLRVSFVSGSQSGFSGFDQPGLLAAEESAFEPILQNLLVNYESAKPWRHRRAALAKAMLVENETPYGDPGAYRVTLLEDGLYSMSYEYLQDQGVDVSALDPKTVKMYNRGQQIPIYVHGARDGRFGPGDYILFWGQVHHGKHHYYSPYTETNVYWLTSGGSIGMRMVEHDGSLTVQDPDGLIIPSSYKTTFRREEEQEFRRLDQVTDETADRWLWQELGSGDSLEYRFFIKALDTESDCRIQVALRGISYPPTPPGGYNHWTVITLNGIPLEDVGWRHQEEHIYDGTSGVPNTWLWEGENVLKIKCARFDIPQYPDLDEVQKIFTNWFQIDFWRGFAAENNYLQFSSPEGAQPGLYEFHLTNFSSSDIELFNLAGKKIVNYAISPDSIGYKIKFQDRIVGPTRYVALSKTHLKEPTGVYPNQASNLHDSSNGADYIIIVHSDFYESVLPLATHRQSQGLRVKVVRVQDVYDEFNDGILSPEAIRDFLQYAFYHWQTPAPTYVLLVGDTSHGYDKAITHQTYWRERCFVPTMMAWTAAWGVSAADNRLVCLAGDDLLPDMAVGRFPVRTADETDVLVDKIIQYETNPEIGPWRRKIALLAGAGATFQQFCTVIDSSSIPPCYEAPRIYVDTSSVHFGGTADLIQQWNEGLVLANFSGHGGGSVWFDANFFLLDHVPLLNNERRLPVVFSLTCFCGFFDNPWNSSLGEEILRAQGKGAVAHFGSSGVAWAYEDNKLGENLFRAMFQYGERALGIITTQGKLGHQRIIQELVDVFNLLGDPAMKIGLPEHEVSLELAENSLPQGETISIQATIPGSPDGDAVVAFCDFDSTGWLVDTTEVSQVDKIYSPRIPLVQEEIAVTSGQFSQELLPPDALPGHPSWVPLPGKKAVTAYFWNQDVDAIGWASVKLDEPILSNIGHEPERPLPWEEVTVFADVELGSSVDPDGPDSVICRWGLRSDLLFHVDLNMSTADGITYQTDEPIKAGPGHSVFYKIVVMYGGVGGSASTDTVYSGRRYFRVEMPSNLSVNRRGLSLGVKGDQLWVNCWVYNTSVEDLDSVFVRFYDDHPDSNNPIGPDVLIPVVPAEDSALAEAAWEAPGEPHDIWVWIVEGDPGYDWDNRTHRYFSNQFLVTSQHGTTVRGASARISHTSGNMACNIPGGAPNQSTLLSIDVAGSQAQYHPTSLNQPGLTLAALKNSGQNLYRPSFEDSTTTMSSATITFWYHSGDSLTQLAVLEGKVKICRLSEELGKWILLPNQEVVSDSAMVQSTVDTFGLFGLFVVDDQKAPTVQINVEGQSFASGDYISSNPIISAAIEDENGIDIHNYPVEISLSGSAVPSSEFSSSCSPESGNLCLVSYMPELSAGSYTLTMKAYDCFGNSAADSIFFNVTIGFQIPFVANHPNPFQEETVIAYVVASDLPAEQVNIRIYTVRGRLIREIQSRNVGPGYIEVIWDGRDADGDRVANGVYYYKMTIISGDGEKISPIMGKMAKLE